MKRSDKYYFGGRIVCPLSITKLTKLNNIVKKCRRMFQVTRIDSNTFTI